MGTTLDKLVMDRHKPKLETNFQIDYMSVQNLKFSEVSLGQPEVGVIWAAAVGSAPPL